MRVHERDRERDRGRERDRRIPPRRSHGLRSRSPPLRRPMSHSPPPFDRRGGGMPIGEGGRLPPGFSRRRSLSPEGRGMSPASRNRARLMEADFVLGPELGGQGLGANGRGDMQLGPLGGMPVVGEAGNGGMPDGSKLPPHMQHRGPHLPFGPMTNEFPLGIMPDQNAPMMGGMGMQPGSAGPMRKINPRGSPELIMPDFPLGQFHGPGPDFERGPFERPGMVGRDRSPSPWRGRRSPSPVQGPPQARRRRSATPVLDLGDFKPPPKAGTHTPMVREPVDGNDNQSGKKRKRTRKANGAMNGSNQNGKKQQGLGTPRGFPMQQPIAMQQATVQSMMQAGPVQGMLPPGGMNNTMAPGGALGAGPMGGQGHIAHSQVGMPSRPVLCERPATQPTNKLVPLISKAPLPVRQQKMLSSAAEVKSPTKRVHVDVPNAPQSAEAQQLRGQAGGQSNHMPQMDRKDSRQPPPESTVIELRLLLACRMHEALKRSASKGEQACGITEDSIFDDFNVRFGHPLALAKIGSSSLRELVQTRCLDIVELQQLKVGTNVRMGYIPAHTFKAMADQVLQKAQEAYTNMMSRGAEVKEELTKSGSGALGTQTTGPAPFTLVKMVKNLLRRLMLDIVVGTRHSLPCAEFSTLFQRTYSQVLDVGTLGYNAVEDFMRSGQVDDVAKLEVSQNGVHYLTPSEKFVHEKDNDKTSRTLGLHRQHQETVGQSAVGSQGMGGGGANTGAMGTGATGQGLRAAAQGTGHQVIDLHRGLTPEQLALAKQLNSQQVQGGLGLLQQVGGVGFGSGVIKPEVGGQVKGPAMPLGAAGPAQTRFVDPSDVATAQLQAAQLGGGRQLQPLAQAGVTQLGMVQQGQLVQTMGLGLPQLQGQMAGQQAMMAGGLMDKSGGQSKKPYPMALAGAGQAQGIANLQQMLFPETSAGQSAVRTAGQTALNEGQGQMQAANKGPSMVVGLAPGLVAMPEMGAAQMVNQGMASNRAGAGGVPLKQMGVAGPGAQPQGVASSVGTGAGDISRLQAQQLNYFSGYKVPLQANQSAQNALSLSQASQDAAKKTQGGPSEMQGQQGVLQQPTVAGSGSKVMQTVGGQMTALAQHQGPSPSKTEKPQAARQQTAFQAGRNAQASVQPGGVQAAGQGAPVASYLTQNVLWRFAPEDKAVAQAGTHQQVTQASGLQQAQQGIVEGRAGVAGADQTASQFKGGQAMGSTPYAQSQAQVTRLAGSVQPEVGGQRYSVNTKQEQHGMLGVTPQDGGSRATTGGGGGSGRENLGTAGGTSAGTAAGRDSVKPAEPQKQQSSNLVEEVRSLLKQEVSVVNPVLLNRLPLLFFNKFSRTLDFQSLGYATLLDMMASLADCVEVAEADVGKILVPPGMAKHYTKQKPATQGPGSYPTARAGPAAVTAGQHPGTTVTAQP
eukprot:evm.model.scf_414EXC.1 EVM.evm.TU.scf_414EXC.1   scf_414EXC:1423-9976(-)